MAAYSVNHYQETLLVTKELYCYHHQDFGCSYYCRQYYNIIASATTGIYY